MDPQVDGTVKNGPRWWLRFDGVVLLVGSLVLFGTTAEPWWLVPLVILVPDLFMAGYAGGTRVGAFIYNLGHTYAVAALVAGSGLLAQNDLVIALGILWFAHIGLDRAAGYGLKYDDAFGHTHLGWIGRRNEAKRAENQTD